MPGASWIFSRDDLQRALLAVRMNGAPLPRDHGVPGPPHRARLVRLRVHQVGRIASTSSRTRRRRRRRCGSSRRGRTRLAAQPRPPLARDFSPAVIDTAAMPVRVEKWVTDGRVFYRVIGIIWGGSKPTNALSIRFRRDLPWVRVDDCPLPDVDADTWSLWTHTWRPEAPGRYQIVLRVDDPSIRTRRLDLFFYVREIEIDEV